MAYLIKTFGPTRALNLESKSGLIPKAQNGPLMSTLSILPRYAQRIAPRPRTYRASAAYAQHMLEYARCMPLLAKTKLRTQCFKSKHPFCKSRPCGIYLTVNLPTWCLCMAQRDLNPRFSILLLPNEHYPMHGWSTTIKMQTLWATDLRNIKRGNSKLLEWHLLNRTHLWDQNMSKNPLDLDVTIK